MKETAKKRLAAGLALALLVCGGYWLLQFSGEEPYHCRVWTGEKELWVQDSEELGEAPFSWIEDSGQREALP